MITIQICTMSRLHAMKCTINSMPTINSTTKTIQRKIHLLHLYQRFITDYEPISAYLLKCRFRMQPNLVYK